MSADKEPFNPEPVRLLDLPPEIIQKVGYESGVLDHTDVAALRATCRSLAWVLGATGVDLKAWRVLAGPLVCAHYGYKAEEKEWWARLGFCIWDYVNARDIRLHTPLRTRSALSDRPELVEWLAGEMSSRRELLKRELRIELGFTLVKCDHPAAVQVLGEDIRVYVPDETFPDRDPVTSEMTLLALARYPNVLEEFVSETPGVVPSSMGNHYGQRTSRDITKWGSELVFNACKNAVWFDAGAHHGGAISSSFARGRTFVIEEVLKNYPHLHEFVRAQVGRFPSSPCVDQVREFFGE